MTWFYHVFFYDIAVEPDGWPWIFIKIVVHDWPGTVLIEQSVCCFIILSLVNKKKHYLRAVVALYVSLAL